jgi:hypothetical protein
MQDFPMKTAWWLPSGGSKNRRQDRSPTDFSARTVKKKAQLQKA